MTVLAVFFRHSDLFDSGCGAVGSALVWGTRGHRFKSGHPDQNIHPENQVLIHGDCLTGLKRMKEESADLVYIGPAVLHTEKTVSQNQGQLEGTLFYNPLKPLTHHEYKQQV